MTAEEFVRAYHTARYPDLPAALAALEVAECEEPICAARFDSDWGLVLVRSARTLKRIGVVSEMREREPMP